MQRLLIIFCTALFVSGCEPAATFSEPQPAKAKPLSSFPERLQGRYLSDDRTSVITLSPDKIVRVYDIDIRRHKDSLAPFERLDGPILVDQNTGTQFPVSIAGDSLIQHIHETDTLFTISESQRLTSFKGYQFLNAKREDGSWEVRKLWLEKGTLTLAVVSRDEDLGKLREITGSPQDTVNTRFTLTRRQFKKFVKQDGFAQEERVTRIAHE